MLAELEHDDLLQDFVADGVEGDDHHAAQERRLEDLVQLGLERLDQSLGAGHGFGIGGELGHRVGAGVGGEDDDGVLEVDLAAFAVLHPAFVEHLVEEFEHVGVGLLDFVEQHDRIRPAADGFGQDAAFAVADVAGRRAFQGGDGVRLPGTPTC